jgi:multidrug transporter EmrE-like cation transporter
VRPAINPLPPEVHYAIWIAVGLLTISLLGSAFRAMSAWPEPGVSEGVEP